MKELFKKAREIGSKHDPLSIAEALYLNTATQGFKITLVSDGISAEIAGKLKLNLLKVSQLQGYLDSRLEEEGIMLGLIHNSAETIPVEA